MTFHLDQARQASSDPLEDPPIQFVHTVKTGRPGRPRVEIEPNLLSMALTLRPKTQIAKTTNCSARTIRRRQLDYGIEVPQPGNSRTQLAIEDNQGSLPPSAEISNEELDKCLAVVMQDFPSFGRRLATASLRANGVMVSEGRVRDSLTRVIGVSGIFGGRRIHRRRYKVPGANSLWHHDGQHGISHPVILVFCTRTYPELRLDSMENCNPWIHRWQESPSGWHPSPQ